MTNFPSDKTINKYLQLLAYGTVEEQCRAARQLGESRIQAAVDPLIEILNQTDAPELCRMIIWALGEIGVMRALPIITHFQDDPEVGFFADAAIEKLTGQDANGGAIPMHEYNSHRESDEQELAAILEALDNEVNHSGELAEQYPQGGGGGVPAKQIAYDANPPELESLVAMLNSDVEPRRLDAAQHLGNWRNPAALPYLERALHDPSADVVRAVLNALVKIGDPSVMPAIRELKDDPRVGPDARRALKQFGTHPLGQYHSSPSQDAMHNQLQQLIHELSSGGVVERARAAKELGRFNSSQATQALLDALNSADDVDIMLADNEILRGNETAFRALIGALRDSEPSVRISVVMSLAKMGDVRAIDPLVDSLRDQEESVLQQIVVALKTMGQSAVEPLMRALRDDAVHVQRNVAKALGQIRDRSAVPVLLEALQNPNFRARAAVVHALGEIGDLRAVEPLIKTLQDKDVTVRLHVVAALGVLGEPYAIPSLVNAGKDPDPFVRHRAMLALREIAIKTSETMIQVLVNDLYSHNAQVQASAVYHLRRIGTPQARDALIEALNHVPRNLYSLLVDAIQKIGNQYHDD